MCGYTSYQDSRLIPPDVNDNDEMTSAECYERCAHGDACRRTYERITGLELQIILPAELDCRGCDLWEE